MDHQFNEVVYLRCMRDASGKLTDPQELNLCNYTSGSEYPWDPQASTPPTSVGWDGLYSNGEFEFDFGMNLGPSTDVEMNSLAQPATMLPPATPPRDENNLFTPSLNCLDSPLATPPLSPSSSFSSTADNAACIRSRSSTASQFSLTASVTPLSAPTHNVLPIITTASLPPNVPSSMMLPTPTAQYNSPIDEDLDALLASFCQFAHQTPECTNLAAAFRHPDQFHLRALLDNILTSPWLTAHGPEPKDEKNRSILLGFLVHENVGGTYRCLFDGCNKSLDRQDRALGHIRMHVGHRPHACNGICGVPECQERFYCQSYLRSHAKRQKTPCDICQQSFFRRDLRKHRLSCQGIQNQAQFMPHYGPALAHARSVRSMGNVGYGQPA